MLTALAIDDPPGCEEIDEQIDGQAVVEKQKYRVLLRMCACEEIDEQIEGKGEVNEKINPGEHLLVARYQKLI